MKGEEVIDFYETAAALSQKMYWAARTNNMEVFGALEAKYAKHVACLDMVTVPKLRTDLRVKKILLLKQLMTYDREIRILIEPGMARLESLLNSQKP